MVGVMGVGGGQVCAQLNRVRALPEVQRGVKLKAAGGKRGKKRDKRESIASDERAEYPSSMWVTLVFFFFGLI